MIEFKEENEETDKCRYMLDFKGMEPNDVSSKENFEQALATMDFKTALERRGSLPTNIHNWCETNHLMISDRGMGGDRWHIGIPFSDPVLALHFMLKAEEQFRIPIENGRLSIHLITWGRSKEPPPTGVQHGGTQ